MYDDASKFVESNQSMDGFEFGWIGGLGPHHKGVAKMNVEFAGMDLLSCSYAHYFFRYNIKYLMFSQH